MNKQASSHYFDASPDSGHQSLVFREEVFGKPFLFTTDKSTFSRKRLDFGSRLMLEVALKELDFKPGERVLDLGCGWGPVGTILQGFYPDLDLSFVEVNSRALDLARANYQRNVGNRKANFLLHDGLAGLDLNFNKIFLNPPVRAGKEVVYRLFQEARDSLLEGGELIVVLQKKQGSGPAKAELEILFGPGQVTDIGRKAGYRILLSQKPANRE